MTKERIKKMSKKVAGGIMKMLLIINNKIHFALAFKSSFLVGGATLFSFEGKEKMKVKSSFGLLFKAYQLLTNECISLENIS